MHKKIVLFICFFIPALVLADNYELKVIKQSANELIIQAEFITPEIDIQDNKDNHIISFKIDGLLQSMDEDNTIKPFLSKQFSLSGNEIQSEIIEIKTDVLQLQKLYLQNSNKSKNNNYYKINHIGVFRDIPIYSLNIFPIKINAQTVTYIKKIKLRIWTDSKKSQNEFTLDRKSKSEKFLLKKMLINGDQINYKKVTNKTFPKTTQRYKSGRYKLLVDQDGIYKVTYSDLVNAGLDLKNINPKKLRLFNKGQEIAIYFHGSGDLSFDSGDYFEFWGEKNKKTFINQYPDMYNDPFSDVNVYWLENAATNGLRMVEESGALIVSNPTLYRVPFCFEEKIHYEKDTHFEHFGQAGASLDKPSYTLDLWYYDSGIYANGNYNYDFFVPFPYSQGSFSVFVKAVMRGRSYRDFDNNQNLNLESHEVELRLNENIVDNEIGRSGLWQDQELHIIKNDIGLPQTMLSHGQNSLKINMNQDGVSDAVIMNWFEVEYWRRYRAYNNILTFRKQVGISNDYLFQFEIDGFTNPNIEIYKKGVSKIVNHRIDFYTNLDDNYKSYRASFQDSIFYSDIEYVAITEDQKKKPISIVSDLPWVSDATSDISLLDQSNSADYLIITHEILYDNVLALKQFHQQQGLNVEVVNTQDIYDEFNYGIKSPLAIKDFITYAYDNWDQNHKLYFVNLVGTSSEDYKTNSQIKPDMVPTILFQTKKYGASASDFQYSLISGGNDDVIPDIVIGRIPARNNTEFLNYMDKLNNYAASSDVGPWTNTALMISGNDVNTKELDNYPHAFRAQNQRMMNYKLPDAYFLRKLNTIRDTTLAVDPNFGGTTDLVNYWDDGVSFINFLGHGGGGIWADVQLFNVNDINRLNNGYKLPFISSLTCFTGAFESRSFSSIADKLITVANKGAIGVYASSGLGWLHNDFAIGWDLTENLFEKNFSIGESILLSKISYLGNGVYFYDDGATVLFGYGGLRKSMVNQYNLLGEPKIYLSKPNQQVTVNLNNTLPAVGDTLEVEVSSPFSSGEVYVELTNENHEPISEDFDAIQSSGNSFSFVIPAELNQQIGFVKAFASSTTQNANGYTKFSVGKSLLDSVTFVPANPQVGQLIDMSVHLHSEIPIESVTLRNFKFLNNKQPDIALSKLNDTLFTTSSSIGPYDKEGTWYFTVEIVDTLGNVAKFHQQKFHITDPRPDFEIVKNTFAFEGQSEIKMAVEIKNNFTDTIPAVSIGFFADKYDGNATPFKTINETFKPDEKKNISFTVDKNILVFDRKYFAVVNYDDLWQDKNPNNNIDSSLVYNSFFLLTKEEGTIDTLSLGNYAEIYIEPDALTENTTMKFETSNNSMKYQLDSQPGFRYIPFGNTNDSSIVKISLGNPDAKIKNDKPAYIAFKIDTTLSPDSLNHIGIYRFSSNLNQWIRIPKDSLSNFIKTNSFGEFALFYVNDSESPTIEITANGRALRNNMLIPASPELAIILQDENGIDITKGINITIDGDTIPRSELNIPENITNSNAIPILATPHFQLGKNFLKVETFDANGNKSTKELYLITTDKFDIKIYGNYPNPFIDETYISYKLFISAPLNEFYAKIYTVSGRMIKKLYSNELNNSYDYGEFYWDGRDDDGNLVANGVYFAVIYAKNNDGKEVEKRIKMAKLK